MKLCTLCLSLTVLAVLVFGAGAFLPGAASTEKYSLVRCYMDSQEAFMFLQSHPDLDVVSVNKRRSFFDIVAREKDIIELRHSGIPFEIIHTELSTYYFSGFKDVDSTGIRTFHEAVAFMDSLRLYYPDVVSAKWSLGQSHEGRDVWCFRLSDNPDINEGEPEILFDGLHHAGEVATFELTLMLAEYLAQKYNHSPGITYLLNNREVYFVPIVNPDGLVYIETTGNPWRKNRRDNGGGTYGVDLNRNYPYMWGGAGSSEDSSANNYRGPSAGSEPEVQALMALVNAHQFITHQSFHAPGTVTFYPWSYSTDPIPDAIVFAHMGEKMTLHNDYEHGQVSIIHTLLSGTTIDWSYGAQDEHSKIFAFTNEIVARGTGGTIEEQLQSIFQDNLWPSIYLIRTASAFLEASDPVVIGGNGNGRLDPGESAALSFTLTNQGGTTDALGVTVTLSSDDSYFQLGEAFRNIGTLPARESINFNSVPFPVTVDPTCPSAHLSELKIAVHEQDDTLNYVLAFVVGESTILFSDNFESGLGAWTTTGTWNTTGSSSHSPSNSLTDSPIGDYQESTRHSATMADGIPAAFLSFWHRYEIEDGFDFGYVQASVDGIQWAILAAYSGYSAGWNQVELPLSDYAGRSVRIRFLLVADDIFTEDGWYIDDVVLTGADRSNATPPPPALVSPAPGEEIDTDPVLIVSNSTDPDGGNSLTYGFRIYADSLCTDLVVRADSIPEGTGQTTWTSPSIADGTYWWRAYAADSIERGLLGETRSFKKSVVTILIQRFEARSVGPAVRLTWDVFSDEALAGFNIYRGDERGGDETLINPYGLIPAGDRSYNDKTIEAGRRYYYILSAVRPNGSEVRSRAVEVLPVVYELSLSHNYPNPFNPNTTIIYSIPRSGFVDLRLYDARGRLVATLVNGKKAAGEHVKTWGGLDDNASEVASGIYFLRLEFGGQVKTRKIVLLR